MELKITYQDNKDNEKVMENFKGTTYWSSTEKGVDNAFLYTLKGKYQNTKEFDKKTGVAHVSVRCVKKAKYP